MYLEINRKQTQSSMKQLLLCEQNLRRASDYIEHEMSMLKYTDTKGMPEVKKKIDRYKKDLLMEVHKIQSMRIAMERILSVYSRTEERVMDCEVRLHNQQGKSLVSMQDFSDVMKLARENHILFR